MPVVEPASVSDLIIFLVFSEPGKNDRFAVTETSQKPTFAARFDAVAFALRQPHVDRIDLNRVRLFVRSMRAAC